MANAGLPLLWFLAIVALIPLVLWLVKRGTTLGGGATGGPVRTVAVLPLSPSQRLVTVEVGSGEERRWLVLGVTPQQISTLHTMSPQAETAAGTGATPPFAQLLGRWRGTDASARDER